jgi:putative transposase
VLTASVMIEPYSMDLRNRAVAMLDEGASSMDVAEALGVSDSWVRKMRLRRDVLGNLAPGSPPGKPRMLTTDDMVELYLLVDEQPDVTLGELAVLMARRLKVRVSISTLSRRLIELGLTRKKRRSTPPKPTQTRSSKSAPDSSAAE